MPDRHISVDVDDPSTVIDALRVALDLAEQARTLLDRFPADLNPLVVARQQLAPIQAALDAFDEALEPLATPADDDVDTAATTEQEQTRR